MADAGTHLIVGNDGLIGSSLKRKLQASGRTVLGTTRKPELIERDMLLLDLAGNVNEWVVPKGLSTAFLCAAITTLKQCESDPICSRLVNVDNLARVAEKLVQNGVFVVFLSTSAVFDGSLAFIASNAPLCPTTEYGRQKADAERQLLALKGNIAIVRPTKVVSPDMPLLKQWREVLERGEPIRPFSDLRMSPISLNFATEALMLIGESHKSGIYHLSGATDVSYAEFAEAWIKHLDFPAHLVHATPAGSSVGKPKFSTLDMNNVTQQLGLKPPTLEQTIASLYP